MGKNNRLKKLSRLKQEHSRIGHRKRLRNRFLQSGLDGFLDYETIELLLTLGTPRKDCKQIAKNAIKEFRGLRGVLDATLDDLQKIKGIGISNALGIKLFQEISELYSKIKIPSKISLNNPKEVADYLKEKIGREKKEHFVALLLDSHSCLISINNISVGTLNSTLVHPREVFEPAIRQLAAKIILAHNHPSGDVKPSLEDIEVTNQMVEAGKIMGIEVLDHLIIGDGFKSLL